MNPAGRGRRTPSMLTGDGSPYEFAFGTGTGGVRYTLELDATSPAHRYARTISALDAMSANSLRDTVRARFESIAAEGFSDYGAWIGGRHDDAGDRYKLYVEVSPLVSRAAQAMARDYLGSDVPHPRHRLAMIGHEPGGATEFYFKTSGGWPTEVLVAFESDTTADPLAFIANLPTPAYSGFSIALSAAGHRAAISVFGVASMLLGDDADVRRALLSAPLGRGLVKTGYPALSAPLAGRPGRNAHTMLAVVRVFGRGSEMRIALSPPEGDPA